MKYKNDTSGMYKILLRKNSVCFDKDYFSEIFFWKSPKCDDLNNFDYKKL